MDRTGEGGGVLFYHVFLDALASLQVSLHTFGHFVHLLTFCPILHILHTFYTFCPILDILYNFGHFLYFCTFCIILYIFHIFQLCAFLKLCTFVKILRILHILSHFAHIVKFCTPFQTLHKFRDDIQKKKNSFKWALPVWGGVDPCPVDLVLFFY